MPEERAVPLLSPFNLVFLAGVALDAPLALIGLFATHLLPLIEVTNTAIVFIKLWSLGTIAVSLASALCASVPDYLPGKRALAISLVLYHTGVAAVLYSCPRFIPVSFGAAFEAWSISPERTISVAHALLGLLVTGWWQATLPLVDLAAQGKLGTR